MLQFATSTPSRHSVNEQIETALKAGCGWIRLKGRFNENEVEEAVKLCKETETVLILDDDIEMVDRMRVHGLHLTEWTRGEVIASREKLGPHAILGVTCSDITLIKELAGLDVDYLVIPSDKTEDFVEYYQAFILSLNEINSEIHPVASGNIPLSAYQSILATGIEGFELSAEILDAPDPSVFFNFTL